MIAIRGIADLSSRLSRLNLKEVVGRARQHAGEQVQKAVREALESRQSESKRNPGCSYAHLADSIGVSASTDQVVIGTADVGAPFLELGTRNEIPHPFLAPTAMHMGEQLSELCASEVVRAVSEVIK